VRLLLDQNLSDRIPARILDLFPGSIHVKALELERADDGVIVEWAKREGFVIASKDTDFYQRSIAFGHPPKFLWLRVGNCSTALVIALLREKAEIIRTFEASNAESVLILDRT